jgi:hypothetical protein
MKNSRANKGQFSIIAALLVSVILVTAVISTYTLVRYTPLPGSPKVLTAIGEMNADIKRILDFTVGYYGSILKVTGNSTYAQSLTTSYLASGLVNIARSHPEWNPSFEFNSDHVSTRWFMPESYSMGDISVTYSLAALGIYGVTYETSSALAVTMLDSDLGVARINVIRDNAEPELGLSKENFWFYNYTADSTWELINPTDLVISSNGVYNITIPSGIDQDAYSIQVDDKRGLMVSAFYSQGSLTSGIPQYTYTFDWGDTDIVNIYDSLSTDTMVIELLQNGTLRWLGQNLELTPKAKPIPPIPVKSLHINTTISGVNQEVPFQVEDWASDYMVPLGLAGNASLFKNNKMMVFLVNHNVEKATLWWDGSDTATQTSYAWKNVYFTDDVSNPDNGQLSNGILHLDVKTVGSPPRFVVASTRGASTSTAEFLRFNTIAFPVFYADTAYVIYNGTVRDIVQQEPEYSGGVAGCPNFYTQVFLTLPANASYYTYTARTVFVNSLQSRSVSDLSVIQLSGLSGTPLTENGTSGSYPATSNSTGLFYNSSTASWDHHWSQISSGLSGAGVMFTDADNQNLYIFDTVDKRGALNVQNNHIEVNPVEQSLAPFQFTDSKDLTWHGAVVTFNGEPIYPSSGYNGLWVMVEYPPSVIVS